MIKTKRTAALFWMIYLIVPLVIVLIQKPAPIPGWGFFFTDVIYYDIYGFLFIAFVYIGNRFLHLIRHVDGSVHPSLRCPVCKSRLVLTSLGDVYVCPNNCGHVFFSDGTEWV